MKKIFEVFAMAFNAMVENAWQRVALICVNAMRAGVD
jgi:hypothetical protein